MQIYFDRRPEARCKTFATLAQCRQKNVDFSIFGVLVNISWQKIKLKIGLLNLRRQNSMNMYGLLAKVKSTAVTRVYEWSY